MPTRTSANGDERLAKTFRALSHPVRVRVLHELTKEQAGPIDYVNTAKTGESLGTVAHHFKALRDAGLIELARTEQRRGALKHTYRLTARGRKAAGWVKSL